MECLALYVSTSYRVLVIHTYLIKIMGIIIKYVGVIFHCSFKGLFDKKSKILQQLLQVQPQDPPDIYWLFMFLQYLTL